MATCSSSAGSSAGSGAGSGSSKGVARESIPESRSAVELTDAEARELKDQYESDFDAATKKSIEKYISNTDFDGKGHSMAQTMNFLINNDIDIQTASREEINRKFGFSLTERQWKMMQKTDANVDKAMHPIGKPVILQRGAHAGEMSRNFGITNYDSLSEAELKSRLVGATFQNKAVMSTSYDVKSNPFLGGGSATGGREIVYNIKTSSGTKMVWGATSQTEAVLGKKINWRVTDVHYTGKIAHPRSGGSYKQLQIDIEAY